MFHVFVRVSKKVLDKPEDRYVADEICFVNVGKMYRVAILYSAVSFLDT